MKNLKTYKDITSQDLSIVQETLLKYFKSALETDVKDSYEVFTRFSMCYGYIAHPLICNDNVKKFIIDNEDIDYNSTFYKSWNDIISKDNLDLYIDQILHYVSTYGTNFEGTPYIPNDKADVDIPPFKDFKFLLPITPLEACERCLNMLYSGIALKSDTVLDILTVLFILGAEIDIEKVKNREAQLTLRKMYGILPKDPQEMVKYLYYLATGLTLFVKNKEAFEKVSKSDIDITNLVEKFGYDKLSSVFLRNKDIFLAFRKGNKNNKVVVNKLRRLAEKNHKPFEFGYFETLLKQGNFKDIRISKLQDNLKNISNFKKVLLLQTILQRLKETEVSPYIVRNQKLFVKEKSECYSKQYKGVISSIYKIIYDDLINSLKDKKCKVRLPKGINITLPSSGKSFIGNYPIGTSFNFSETDNIIGIYWKDVDGANDLDLSLVSLNGDKYGWNGFYTNEKNSIIYSGDMTSANPEAVELFYTSGKFEKDFIVKVNLYSGKENSKFKFFIAQENIKDMKRNYMVNPDNILFKIDSEMDSKEKSLGILTDGKFILAQLRTGKGKVSGNDITNLYTKFIKDTSDCFINLEKTLKDAGFEFVEDNADIDFTNLSKDTLINLLGV